MSAQPGRPAPPAPLATTAIPARSAIAITLSHRAVPSPARPAAPRATTASNAPVLHAHSARLDSLCPPAPLVLPDIPALDALTAILDFSERTASAIPARRPSILAATCATTGSPAPSAPPGTTLPSIALSAQMDTSTRPPMAIRLSAPSAPRTAPRAHRAPHALPASLDLPGRSAGDAQPVTPLLLATNAILITFPREEESAVPAQAPTEFTAASAPTQPFVKYARSDGKAPNAIPAPLATTAITAMAASQLTTRRELSVSPAPKSTRTASHAMLAIIVLPVLSASQAISARNAPPDTSIIVRSALWRTIPTVRVPAFPA